MRLKVENFQSWTEADLRFDGFTVVVGSSNRGKSALTRALRGLLRGDISQDQVKLGTKALTLTLDRGVPTGPKRIVASRTTKGSTVYKVDEDEYAKLGGSAPPSVQALGYEPVEVNGLKIDPIFAGQFDSQFMVASTPAEVSGILGAFSATERLDKGKAVLKSKVTEFNAEAKVLGGQISTLEVQEAALAVLAERAVKSQEEIQTRGKVVQHKSGALIQLDGFRSADHRGAQARRASQAIGRTRVALVATRRASKGIQAVADILTASEQGLKLVDALDGLAVLELVLSRAKRPAKALDHLAAYRHHRREHTKYAKLAEATASVQPLLEPALIRYKALVHLGRVRAAAPFDLSGIQAKLKQVTVRRTDVERIQRAVLRCGEAISAQAKHLDLAGVLAAQSKEKATIQDEVRRIEDEIDQMLLTGRAVTCPKCKLQFTPNHAH